ncbi:non-ribosomal peptide synthetase, partial [Pseudoalteromonas ulvae]|uniref:non-ribosomal peptide synthetase n=1 Tax=Pseudoalteromonas ulvae TaxID=107327 RepID=UPI00186B7DB1
MPRTIALTPLFQIMLTVNEDGGSDDLEFSGMAIEPIHTSEIEAKFDLSLDITIEDSELAISWVYDTALFTQQKIETLNQHFCLLAQQFLAEPSHSLADLNMLSEAELTYQCDSLNQTHSSFDDSNWLHSLFEKQVKDWPEQCAIVDAELALSYLELNEQANRLSYYLIAQGVDRGSRVGVWMHRGIDWMTSVLAILKVGGTYVPLDPAYPASRLSHMINDSQALLVLSTSQVEKSAILESSFPIIEIDTETSVINACNSDDIEVGPPNENDIAYVIYTSGSTGMPKGVPLTHRGAVNLALTTQQYFKIEREDRVMQFASPSFDAATWEWMMALCSGATLFVCDSTVRQNGEMLSAFISDQKITHAVLPPTLLNYLDINQPYAFKALIVGGEVCAEQAAWKWAKHVPLFNAYGPSEATVCSHVAKIEVERPVVIGSPIANTRQYVLDSQLNVQPQGTIGELYLAGDGVSSGYINRPELNAERFIQATIFGKTERLYRTGDLVQLNEDGQLKFIGRNDDQVNVRGFRIELSEVEQLIDAQECVKSNIVLVNKETSPEHLVAFVELSENSEQLIASAALKQHLDGALSNQMPRHMLPSHYVMIDAWPMTANGKVDKKALHNMLALKGVVGAGQSPSTSIEKTLALVCARVLKLNQTDLDISASFFELGGHSLLLIQFMYEIEKAFSVSLSVAQLMSVSSLTALATLIENSAHQTSQAIEPLEENLRLLPQPLSFAQQRLWAIDKFEGGSAHYNMS